MLKQLEQIGTLEEIKNYKCKAISLSDSLSILGIRINHHEIAGLNWILYFVGVHYFQGPIFWTGANFVKAPKETCFDVWKITHPNFSDQRLEQLYISQISSVCILETASQPILIEYGDLSISKQDNTF